MDKHSIPNVPHYFKPYVNDCFSNAYGTILSYMGQNPDIILADYLSFMYDPQTEYIGVNYFFQMTPDIFIKDKFNTSWKLVNIQPDINFNKNIPITPDYLPEDCININMYVNDDPTIAHARAKELIDNNIPVIAALDLYYMDYHRAFQKEHGAHCVILTGYDEDEGWYELFDKYQLSSSDFSGRHPISIVKTARMAENVTINPFFGEHRRVNRNGWIEINISPEFKITEDKLFFILKESCRRMFSQTTILGHQCGLGSLTVFRNSIVQKQEQPFNDRSLFYFRNYLNTNLKGIARSRLRFKAFINTINYLLPSELVSEVANDLEESSSNWDIAATLALKIGISESPALITNLNRRLGIIQEIEVRLTDRLGSFVVGKGN